MALRKRARKSARRAVKKPGKKKARRSAKRAIGKPGKTAARKPPKRATKKLTSRLTQRAAELEAAVASLFTATPSVLAKKRAVRKSIGRGRFTVAGPRGGGDPEDE